MRENIGSKRFDCSGAGYADGRFSIFPGLRRRRRNFPSPVSALFAQVVGYRLFTPVEVNSDRMNSIRTHVDPNSMFQRGHGFTERTSVVDVCRAWHRAFFLQVR